MKVPAATLLTLCAVLLDPRGAGAQDLEPRSYTASPIGLNFVVAGALRSAGGVVVDPSLPFDDVEATVDSAVLGLGTTFDLAGRTALLTAALPYAWATATGTIGETTASTSRSGLADMRVKLSVNLLGGAALTPREFAMTPRSPTIIGVSVAVAPPTGQYYPAKLVNLGGNRWSWKPEIGVSHAIGRWTVDGYLGFTRFTTNDEFYPGESVRTQARVFSLQAHASYTLRPRLWMALDATWYSGGTTSIDGTPKADLQRNSRLGATASIPLGTQQSLKFAYSAGATTRIGGDFKTFGVTWQLAWFR